METVTPMLVVAPIVTYVDEGSWATFDDNDAFETLGNS